MLKSKHILGIVFLLASINTFSQQRSQLKLNYESMPLGIEEIELAISICDENIEKAIDVDTLQKYTNGFQQYINQSRDESLTNTLKLYLGAIKFNSDTSFFFKNTKDLLRIARINDDQLLYGRAAILLSKKYLKTSDLNKGLNQVLACYNYLENYDDQLFEANKFSLATSLCALYRRKPVFSEAIKFGLLSDKHAELSKNVEFKIKSYSNLGAVYGTLALKEKNYSSEGERLIYDSLTNVYLKKAYKYCKNKGIDRSLGIATYNLGIYKSSTSDFETSFKLMHEGAQIGKDLNFELLTFNCYNSMGVDFMTISKPDSAIFYFKLAESLAEKNNWAFHSITNKINLAQYYLETGDLSKAEKIALEVVEVSTERNMHGKLRTIKEMLYQIELKKENHAKALAYYLSFRELSDSISSSEQLEKINILKAKYDFEKQQSKIELLEKSKIIDKQEIKKKNGILALVIVLSLFLISILYLLSRQRTLLSKKRELIAKQKLLRTQLNPHFIFNALSSIQQYIYQRKDPKEVADYLAKFAMLTRRILQNSNEELIDLSDEIEFLKDYMDLQKLRFDIPFEYSIIVDENLFVDEIKIPPMFTQPFIENSIEHGILKKDSKGKIDIQFVKVDDELKIILQDNGIGISKALFEKKNSKRRSLAIDITKERLKSFNKKIRKKTELVITDLSNTQNLVTGTKVVLKIPIFY